MYIFCYTYLIDKTCFKSWSLKNILVNSTRVNLLIFNKGPAAQYSGSGLSEPLGSQSSACFVSVMVTFVGHILLTSSLNDLDVFAQWKH